MGGFESLWAQGDAVTRLVALVLLAMSVAAWVLILWKAWTLGRARRGLASDVRPGQQQVEEMLKKLDTAA